MGGLAGGPAAIRRTGVEFGVGRAAQGRHHDAVSLAILLDECLSSLRIHPSSVSVSAGPRPTLPLPQAGEGEWASGR